jgi:hypothetical protein
MVGKMMKRRSAITLIVAGRLLLCGAGLTAAGNFSSRHDNTSAAGSNLVPKASNSAMTDYLPVCIGNSEILVTGHQLGLAAHSPVKAMGLLQILDVCDQP